MVLILLSSLLLFSEKIQNKILGSLTEKVTETMDGKLEFASVRIVPFNTAVITDAVILDAHPYNNEQDTLGYVRKLKASFTLRSLLSKHGVELSRLDIDGGWFNLVTEPLGTGKTSNLHRVFGLKNMESLPEESPDIFRFKRVKIRDFRFTLRNFLKTGYQYNGIGINWQDLDLTANIDVRNMIFSDMIMSGTVDRLDAVEECGYRIENCSGEVVVGRGKTTVRNLKIHDGLSDLDLPLYRMTYDSVRDFVDFQNKVTIQGDFNESVLAMKTISYYSGVLADNACVFGIESGSVLGTVNDFIATGLRFTENVNGVVSDLDCHISGITDMEEAKFNLETRELKFSIRSLARIINAFAGPGSFKPGNLGKNSAFNLRCKVNGSLDDLSADAILRSTSGRAAAHAALKNLASPKKDASVRGYVRASDFNLGKFLGIKEIGKLDGIVSGSAELLPGNPRISVDSVQISRISLLGHDYHDIYGKGGYGKMGPFGTVIVNDPAVKLVAGGERMKYTVSVPEIDLAAIGLDNRKSVSKAMFNAGINFYQDRCELGIFGLRLTDDSGIHDIGNLRAEGIRDGESQSLRLNSAFVTANAYFSSGIAAFVKDIQYATTRRELDVLYTDIPEDRTPADCNISLGITDCRELLGFLLPDLKIFGNTALELSLDSGRLESRFLSDNVAWKDMYIRGLDVKADNSLDRINLSFTSGEIRRPGLALNNTGLTAFADDNNFSASAEYYGAADSLNRGHLHIEGNLFRTEDDSLGVRAHINDSEIILAGTNWSITPSDIEYAGGTLKVTDFAIGNGDQSIEAGGGIRRDGQDRFTLNIRNLKLGLFNNFLNIPAEISGKLNGGAILLSPVSDKLQLAMNVRSDSVSLSGINTGAFIAGSAWDDENQRLNIMLQNFRGNKRALDVKAFFAPSSKTIDAVAALDGFNLKATQPLLNGIFSDIDGSISGKINCSGPLDSLSIFSDGTRLDDVILKVAYTGVPYTVNGDFFVEKSKLRFDSLSIRDADDGNATVSGSISNIFRDPSLNASLDISRLKVLNVDEASAEGLYGNLAVSGNASASGPFSNLVIDGTINTYGAGEIHLPLNSAMTQSRKELLTFVEKNPDTQPDYFSDQADASPKKTAGNIIARAKVRLSPDVTAYAEIDKSSGNMISAYGDGDVEIDLDAARNSFQINGDYLIRGGNYKFAIPGLIGKDLTISDGSSIKFSGDLMDTQLDLNAIYSLKTSIAPLTTDTTSVSTRRQVNCSLSITDRLRNPKIGLGVDIPDLDPMTKAQVQTALNTEDKIQRQFVSLLLLNSFLPSETSGIINANSNMLYANMAEMMSGQLNSILQKLEIPLDLGFGYQVGDAGTDIFDVAISTQLFNNRVIVGGSVGNRKYSTSTSANGDVVGDLDIEVKIDRSGQLRFKLFSHSADEFTSFLDYTQRNGIGVTYQREFGHGKHNAENGNESLKKIVIDE